MKTKKSGMSVIALVGSVAIILILLTTVTISGVNTAHNAKKIAFGLEIKMIQGAVDSYYTKNNATYPVKEKAYELNFENDSSKNKKIFQDNEGEEKTVFTTYEIDCDLIGLSDLTYGNKKESNENDVYVLSRASGKVYYLKGLEIGGELYYTVTDDIENLLSYNTEKNTVNSPVIKFIPSTTNWTKRSIEVEIKIPSTCTLTSVLFNNTQKTLADSKLTITENGTLTVKYVENIAPSQIKEAQYIVSNIDKIAPTVQINKEELVQIASRGDLGYIKIKEKSDNLSGIKSLKYEYGDVTDFSSYFKTSGIDIKEDIIFFRELTEPITIYAEDKAGNISVQKVTPKGDIIKEEIKEEISEEYPPIPNGFVASGATGEKDVNNGFVIYEGTAPVTDANVSIARTTRNQFVWIPVEKISDFVRKEGYYFLKLQDELKDCSEPWNDSNVSSEEKEEYAAMYASVKKYGGFYIARYEASNNGNEKAQYVSNVYPWVNIEWGSMRSLTSGAVYKARNVYPVTNATKDKDPVSTLVYGVQWDAVVQFLEKNYPGISENCLDYSFYEGMEDTGSNSDHVQNNIYNICSNCREWTMEATSDCYRIIRGSNGFESGYYYPVSYRQSVYYSSSSLYISFRSALYLK